MTSAYSFVFVHFTWMLGNCCNKNKSVFWGLHCSWPAQLEKESCWTRQAGFSHARVTPVLCWCCFRLILELFQHYGFSGPFSAALSGNTMLHFIIFAGVLCNALLTRGSCWKHWSCKIYSPKWAEPLLKSYITTAAPAVEKPLFLLPFWLWINRISVNILTLAVICKHLL